MIRISLPFIFRLSTELEPLAGLPDAETPFSDVWFALWSAESALSTFSEMSLYVPYLRSSVPLAQTLLKHLRAETTNFDMNRQVDQHSFWKIKNTYSQYKTAVLAELDSLISFFVAQKGPFDTYSLLFWGENLFPADLASKVPEAIFDAKEAGKCLAYEVATACGFHVFRAAETVLRRYYSHVTGGAAHPKVRTLGIYARALERTKKGDPKIIAAILQMTELHRNPLIHPEAVLMSDEAIAVIGIARSLITAMLAVLPVVPPTTTTLTITPPAVGATP